MAEQPDSASVARPARGGGPVQFGVQPGPLRVERGQPAHQAAVLCLAAGEPLEEVVVGADQARGGQAAAAVHHPRPGHGGCGSRPDGGDPPVLEDEMTRLVLGARVGGGDHTRRGAVDGGYRASLDDQAVHPVTLLWAGPALVHLGPEVSVMQ